MNLPAGNIMGSPDDVRFELSGAFDAACVAVQRLAIEALAATTARRVVLDLSGVSSLDGSGVGAISFLFKRLVARGRKLVVTGVAGQPLTMLTELGLLRALGLNATPVRSSPRRQGWFGGLAVAGGR
jgi:anti-anti-sigma factor